MSVVRFIGCLHLGHEKMAKWRGYNNCEEYHKKLIKNWNNVVNKKDITYILGDVTLEKSIYYPILDELKGNKYLVMGNHDMGKHNEEQLKYFKKIMGCVDYKGYLLTHCPIHPNEVVFYRGNIHAHLHENNLEEVVVSSGYDDEGSKPVKTLHKYFNVDAHRVNCTPISINNLKYLNE